MNVVVTLSLELLRLPTRGRLALVLGALVVSLGLYELAFPTTYLGGVLMVPQSTQRPPRRPSISSAPRVNIALSGGTPMGIVSPVGTSCPRARNASAYDTARPPVSASATSSDPAMYRPMMS